MVYESIVKLGWSKHLQLSCHGPALLPDLAKDELARQPVCSRFFTHLCNNLIGGEMLKPVLWP